MMRMMFVMMKLRQLPLMSYQNVMLAFVFHSYSLPSLALYPMDTVCVCVCKSKEKFQLKKKIQTRKKTQTVITDVVFVGGT